VSRHMGQSGPEDAMGDQSAYKMLLTATLKQLTQFFVSFLREFKVNEGPCTRLSRLSCPLTRVCQNWAFDSRSL
jgi:hypothetical protein